MKRTLSFIVLLIAALSLYGQNNSSKIKFIKGNISDKTAAVREASGADAEWISDQAIDFCLEN